MKFCLIGSSLQSKTKIAEENCIKDGLAGAEDIFNKIEQMMKKEPNKEGKAFWPNKQPKPEHCPTFEEVIEAYSMSYAEKACFLYEFGWLHISGLHNMSDIKNTQHYHGIETLGSWANTENIEADLRNLTTIISEALLPLLDHHINTKPQVAKCYEDAETSIMKNLFPGCSELTFEEEEEYMVNFLMSLATWIECFHSMFEDACKEHVDYTWMNMVNGKTMCSPTTEGYQTTTLEPATTKLEPATTTLEPATTTPAPAKGYLYISETKILDLSTFKEVSCEQHFPERPLTAATAGIVSYNNKEELMLCGGNDMTGCRIWTKEGWAQSDTTFNRKSSTASETSAGLLVTGGWDKKSGKKLNSTLLYTTKWQNFTELPVATSHHCQITINDTVYIVGGEKTVTFSNGTSTYEVLGATYKLTKSKEWSELSSLITPRTQHACVEWDGGILAIGGVNRGGGLSSVERYNIVSNKWFSYNLLPVKLKYHHAVVWADDLYVFGGYDQTNKSRRSVVYKLKKGSKTWEVVPGVSVSTGTAYRPIFPAIAISNIHCNN